MPTPHPAYMSLATRGQHILDPMKFELRTWKRDWGVGVGVSRGGSCCSQTQADHMTTLRTAWRPASLFTLETAGDKWAAAQKQRHSKDKEAGLRGGTLTPRARETGKGPHCSLENKVQLTAFTLPPFNRYWLAQFGGMWYLFVSTHWWISDVNK